MKIEDIKVGDRLAAAWNGTTGTVIAKTNAWVWVSEDPNPDHPTTYAPQELMPLPPTEVGRRKIINGCGGGTRAFETTSLTTGSGPYLVKVCDVTYRVEVVE